MGQKLALGRDGMGRNTLHPFINNKSTFLAVTTLSTRLSYGLQCLLGPACTHQRL